MSHKWWLLELDIEEVIPHKIIFLLPCHRKETKKIDIGIKTGKETQYRASEWEDLKMQTNTKSG